MCLPWQAGNTDHLPDPLYPRPKNLRHTFTFLGRSPPLLSCPSHTGVFFPHPASLGSCSATTMVSETRTWKIPKHRPWPAGDKILPSLLRRCDPVGENATPNLEECLTSILYQYPKNPRKETWETFTYHRLARRAQHQPKGEKGRVS